MFAQGYRREKEIFRTDDRAVSLVVEWSPCSICREAESQDRLHVIQAAYSVYIFLRNLFSSFTRIIFGVISSSVSTNATMMTLSPGLQR